LTFSIEPLRGIPLVQPGDDLATLVLEDVAHASLTVEDGDIFVFAQKIVSKAEGRLVNLNEVTPSDRAREYARIVEKDARFIELVLRESKDVLRVRQGTIIVEHRHGFVCANAGIDHSNVRGPWGSPDDWVLLLPENPDESARKIRESLQCKTGKRLGVAIIDSHGRAWRLGTVGVAIGIAGVPGLVDMRGKPDLFGYQLRVTLIAAADELAAAASLIMGQADEAIPAVLVRGFPFTLRESALSELIRPRELDLFR
jgi:coenzyme F420-0:L-glutamate ligase/coenzyme F420-1:gamma-L-glutamate ligase